MICASQCSLPVQDEAALNQGQRSVTPDARLRVREGSLTCSTSCVNALWRDKALDLGSGRHARLLAVAAVRAIFLPGAAFPCSQGAARNSLALIRSTFHARIETGQPDGSNSQLAKYTYRFLCRRLDPWCHLELLRCRELLQIAPMMEIAPIKEDF